jgi:hypothetical protein
MPACIFLTPQQPRKGIPGPDRDMGRPGRTSGSTPLKTLAAPRPTQALSAHPSTSDDWFREWESSALRSITYRQARWATLSPAGGLHLGLFPLLVALIGGEVTLTKPNTILMQLRPCCAGGAMAMWKSRPNRVAVHCAIAVGDGTLVTLPQPSLGPFSADSLSTSAARWS